MWRLFHGCSVMFLTHASAHTLHLLFPNSEPLDHFQHSFISCCSVRTPAHSTCDSNSDCFLGRKTSVCSLVNETCEGSLCNAISTDVSTATLPTAEQSCTMLVVMITFFLKAPSSIPHTATTTNPLVSSFWEGKKRACYWNLASFYGS